MVRLRALTPLGVLALGEVMAPGPGPEEVPPPHPIASSPAPQFVENRGQWDSEVLFAGHVEGLRIAVVQDGLVVELSGDGKRDGPSRTVRVRFEGVSSGAAVEGEAPHEATFNWILGNDRSKWITRVPSFDAVRFRGIRPGVDLRLHAGGSALEYELIGSSDGNGPLATFTTEWVDHDSAGAGDASAIDPPRPETILCHCEVEGTAARGTPMGRDQAGTTKEAAAGLSALTWSTYLGSTYPFGIGDTVTAAHFHPGGDLFVAGITNGPGFPVTSGVYSHPGEQVDAFVVRMSADTARLIYSTVIGGMGQNDGPETVNSDPQGAAIVAGTTNSSDFPVTAGAFQVGMNGPSDAFVLKLSPAGEDLVFSTFLGGAGNDDARGVDVAPDGAILVGGVLGGTGFPTTPGAYQTLYNGIYTVGFLSCLEQAGNSLRWSTLIDGVVQDVQLGSDDTVTAAGLTFFPGFPIAGGGWAPSQGVPGERVMVLRLDPTGSSLKWSSVFGGANQDLFGDLALQPSGEALVVGWTNAPDFPTTPGSFQPVYYPSITNGFVVRLEPGGTFPRYSTFFGGTGSEIRGCAIDPSGMVTITGGPGGRFPATPGAFQTTDPNPFVARLNPAGNRVLYATYLGGPGTDVSTALTASPERTAFVGGWTNGAYPTTPNAPFPTYQGGQTDGYLTAFDLVLQGLQLKGTSTASCLGPLHANGTEMPVSGSTRFAVFCSGAPPLGAGWLLLGEPLASPILASGVELWVRPRDAVGLVPVLSDGDGWVEVLVPLTNVPAGTRLGAQYLFQNSPTCTGTAVWSSSNLLAITVQ